MLTARRLADFLCTSPVIRSYALFWVFPVFVIQLCLYLNIHDRPPAPLFFLQVALAVFFVLASALYILLRILGRISKQTFAQLLVIFDIFFVALFILAIFFPVQHALLDGQEYPPVPLLTTLKQLAIPVVAIASLFLLSKKKPQEFKTVQITILAASLFFIAYSAVSMKFASKKDFKAAENTKEAACALGKRNVILLIVETLQGDYLEELAAASPELFASFSGMTLFPRAVTSTAWSPFSAVQIFSGGNDWSKHGTRAAAIDTLKDDSLLTSARDSGYRFSGGKYTPVPSAEYVSTPNKDIPLVMMTLRMLLTHSKYYTASLRRVIPAVAWNRLQELEDTVYSRYHYAGLQPFKIEAKNNFIALTKCLRHSDTNTFLYFFNYMTHLAILFDRDGNAIPGLPQNKETQLDEYRYTLALYAAFVDKLKHLGAYDNSLIIIAGDHGAYNEPGRSYNPAVLIKPPHAEGKPAISRANLLLTDIRPLVEAYMRGDDDACRAEFLRLSGETGPRKMRVYTPVGRNYDPPVGRNFDSGQAYQLHDIFGDIETVIQTVNRR